MNIEKNLLLLKGEDKTEQVHHFENIDGGKIKIIFNNGDKEYIYTKSQLEFYNNPVPYEISNDCYLTSNKILASIKGALKFGDYIKLFFNDNATMVVNESDIVKNLYEEKDPINTFNYFKEISKIVSLETIDGRKILAEEYNNIKSISDETVLYDYLNSKKNNECFNDEILIFPFGSNKSQKQAVENAIKNKISVIEGPPGTGKTQTILNIIANIVARGKNVAVVSNNNSATENVYEKLKSKDLGYICAFLGNRQNKEEFINSQTGEYPQLKNDLCDSEVISKIEKYNYELDRAFELENSIAQREQLLKEYNLQYEYFKKENVSNYESEKYIRTNCDPDMLMKLSVELEYKNSINMEMSIWDKIKYSIIYRCVKLNFFKLPYDIQSNLLNRMFYALKIYKISRNIKEEKVMLKNIGKNKALSELTRLSMIQLNYTLKCKYRDNNIRRIFKDRDLKVNSSQFVMEYPIIFSTTHSIKNCLNKDFVYDYVIVDEASQVDLITGTLAFSCAKNVVIVGDRKQLSTVISNESKINEITKSYRVRECYDFCNENLLSSTIKTIKNIPFVLLKEHYRCHPKIIDFANKKFYNNQLIILTKDEKENDVLKVIVTPEGNHARGHYNERQVNIITDEVIQELENKVNKDEIGIVSPYNVQKESITKTINDSNIKVDTVHKYQGREKDAIIITTVDNQVNDFIDDSRLLNVAITRAKRYLRLIVSKDVASSRSNIGDLVRYIRYNNFEVKESKINSIYDLLYKSNREKRLEYLKDKKLISQYDSENLTYNLIQEVIKDKKFNNLDVVAFVPLKDIIKEYDLLTEDEKSYAKNSSTHLDFVLYNKMDKIPVLAIEVDGYMYHKEGTIQSTRDEKKTIILRKYDIPLLRLSTIGNNEKFKITQMLEKTSK